ncbi:MAG: potassium channel family protein [Pseudomonadota bacterium]
MSDKQDWKNTLIGGGGMVVVSAGAFYLLSHLDENTSGDTLGNIATIGLAIWLLSQFWFYITLIRNPHQQLALMGISFIQVVPFLFAAVYGAFGYSENCISGSQTPTDVLYFSYVTFTTVGFGDLHPIGLCRAIAVSEAITGYILLGLFVAAAVSVFEHQRRARQ